MHLENLLRILKTRYKIFGIKVETESEGASFEDIYQLRALTNRAGLPLYLKIGGVEALNDIIQAYKVGVDGVIAPMVETEFALYKFLSSIDLIYKNQKIDLTINIETKTAIEKIATILHMASGKVSNINIGRTDLSASYFEKGITPNSKFITDKIKEVMNVAKQYNFKVSFGGSVDIDTIELVKRDKLLLNNLSKIETRKVMFDPRLSSSILNDILEFEKQLILHKKCLIETENSKDLVRLKKLESRV